MKLNQLLTASVLGFSLLTTSAFASDHSNNSSSTASHWSLIGWFQNVVAESHRECDQNGQNTGTGNNCDRGKGNGGGYCGTGGSTSGGGSTGGSTGGGTVGPKG